MHISGMDNAEQQMHGLAYNKHSIYSNHEPSTENAIQRSPYTKHKTHGVGGIDINKLHN